MLRRTTPTGLARVWTPLRVVSTQYLQQLEAYTSQVALTQMLTLTLALALTPTLTLALTPKPKPKPDPNPDPNP